MIEDFKKELQKLKRELEEKLKNIRSHRLSLNFLENIEIEIYNQKFPLKSLGLLSQLDSLTFRFEPFDPKTILEIEKAFQQRKQNFSFSREKTSLIIRFPPLTEELRKNLLRSLSSLKEEIKIKARLLRDDFLRELRWQKENKKISEDRFYKTKEDLDQEIEKFNNEVDKIFSLKEKEILQ